MSMNSIDCCSSEKQHIFIIGAKSVGQYGGYETFVDRLTDCHRDESLIQYHIACKANGSGCMDETKLSNVTYLEEGHQSFVYNNAHVFKIRIPQIGNGAAIIYDIKALKYCIDFCEKKQIKSPIFYVLACRIGPFIGRYRKKIHALGGRLFVNPDGHEWKRGKWTYPVRKYWKESERLMIKSADLVVCDSTTIEQYIQTEYARYSPKCVFIAYGSDLKRSVISDDDPKYLAWLNENNLRKDNYYLVVGRCVPENNFDVIIREVISSNTDKDLVLITDTDNRYMRYIMSRYNIGDNSRIHLAGTLYDKELLKKVREHAYAYIHGHSVGGTNPSLLEALASTNINLLLDVGFNREVAKDGALYWQKDSGSLKKLIESIESYDRETTERLGDKARGRIRDNYSWKQISDKYIKLWLDNRI